VARLDAMLERLRVVPQYISLSMEIRRGREMLTMQSQKFKWMSVPENFSLYTLIVQPSERIIFLVI
jgi:hypothetical protein